MDTADPREPENSACQDHKHPRRSTVVGKLPMHSQNLESGHSIAQYPSQAGCGGPTAIAGFGGLEVKVYNHVEILSFPRDRTTIVKKRCGSVYEGIRITGQQKTLGPMAQT